VGADYALMSASLPHPAQQPPPLERAEFDAAELVRAHPPQVLHPNKAVVYEVATSTSDPFEGRIRYARWPETPLPPSRAVRPAPAPPELAFDVRQGIYDYEVDPEGRVEWHVNFADPHLFGMYEWALFAQDEIQVAEHPILGSLRHALTPEGKATGPRTIDAARRPTPVTVTGAQRRVAINTRGIYGNAFGGAAASTIRAACRVLSPPTMSNILAMAAPNGGRGAYSRAEVLYVANCAYTGFHAAAAESARIADTDEPSSRGVLIHTGFWGCGAFGGNRTLMPMLQALAADLAGVDIAFHAFGEAGVATAREAVDEYRRIRDAAADTAAIVDAIVDRGFEWGMSDGN